MVVVMPEHRLTWGELKQYLNQTYDTGTLDCSVAIVTQTGEFVNCFLLESEDDDILDNGHPYLEIIE